MSCNCDCQCCAPLSTPRISAKMATLLVESFGYNVQTSKFGKVHYPHAEKEWETSCSRNFYNTGPTMDSYARIVKDPVNCGSCLRMKVNTA